MNHKQALQRDIRELTALAHDAHAHAKTALLMGDTTEGQDWIDLAREYEEQVSRLQGVLRAYHRSLRSDGA